MGAPVGHPFFGNQYTDGDYVLGSFTYEVLEKGVDIAKAIVSEMGKGTTKEVLNITTKQQIPKNLGLSAVDKAGGKGFGKNQLIIAGVLTVVTIGGCLIYRYINKKSKAKKETTQSIELNVGTCIKCGEPLVESEYIPGSEVNDYKDACIICKNCGEKNFARYPDENNLS